MHKHTTMRSKRIHARGQDVIHGTFTIAVNALGNTLEYLGEIDTVDMADSRLKAAILIPVELMIIAADPISLIMYYVLCIIEHIALVAWFALCIILYMIDSVPGKIL